MLNLCFSFSTMISQSVVLIGWTGREGERDLWEVSPNGPRRSSEASGGPDSLLREKIQIDTKIYSHCPGVVEWTEYNIYRKALPILTCSDHVDRTAFLFFFHLPFFSLLQCFRTTHLMLTVSIIISRGQRARPGNRTLVMYRGMPSQGGSTKWRYLYLIKCREPTVG